MTGGRLQNDDFFYFTEVSLLEIVKKNQTKTKQNKTKQNKTKQKQIKTLAQLQVSNYDFFVRFYKSELILRRTELGCFR